MNLRTKTFLIIVGVFIFAFLVMGTLLWYFINRAYTSKETLIMTDKVAQVRSTLDDTTANLKNLAADWAEWDDTYQFVQDHNPEFIQSNFVSSSFFNNRLNLAVVIDAAGQTVYSGYYNWVPANSGEDSSPSFSLEQAEVPDGLTKYLTAGSLLLNGPGSNPGVSGIISLPYAPMLAVSHPILPSSGSGTARGTLIFGRYLDNIELARISNVTQFTVSGYAPDSSRLPADYHAALSSLTIGAMSVVRMVDANTIAGYSLLTDLNGQPAFIIGVTAPRVFYNQSRNDVLTFTLALIAFGLISVFVMLAILERLVISRITRLSGRVTEIGKKGDLAQRVKIDGQDEISSLSQNINGMLGNIETARKSQKESETFNYVLLQDSPNPIQVMNLDGSLRYVNPALEKITGYSSTQLIGRKPPFPWWINESAAEHQSELQEAAAKGIYKIEKRFQKPDGTPFWVEITSTAIKQDDDVQYFLANWVEITERKRAEEALRNSENKFRELSELLPELVFEIDLNGHLTFVNRIAFSVFGYSSQDCQQLTLIDLIVPEEREVTRDNIRKMIEGEDFGNTERLAVRKDGSRFPAFLHATQIRNSLGQVTGLRGILVDITTQKEIESELRASEEFSSSLLNNSPNPIIVCNVDYPIRYINPALERLTGYSSVEVIGKGAPHPWWLEGQTERLDFILDQNFEQPALEKCYRKRNGELFWVTVTNNPFIENGQIQYYVGSWVDITERKRTEEALKESEEFSSSLRDNSPYPIIVFGNDHSIKYVNSALEKITGYSSAELVGRKPPFPYWPPTHLQEYTAKLPNAISLSAKIERLYQNKAGDIFHVEIITTPIKKGTEVQHTLAVWVDITAQRLASAQLEKLYKREKNLREALQSEIRSRTEFTRALVHELKTPLTPIMASSELLVEELREEPLLGLAKNVFHGAENMNRRVDELLDLARGEVGMLKVNLNPVESGKLLCESLKYMEPAVNNNHQTLSLEMPDNLPIILADEDRLRQILFNLIGNSIKYSPPGGQIKIRARVEDANLIIEVQDNGRGMSEEEQTKLFQPYYRIEGREHLSGLGLGLALSKRLIELQNGKIWVQSEKGQGSTFGFSIPIGLTSQSDNIAKTGGPV
jgi:two-component system, sensor histidine kinase